MANLICKRSLQKKLVSGLLLIVHKYLWDFVLGGFRRFSFILSSLLGRQAVLGYPRIFHFASSSSCFFYTGRNGAIRQTGQRNERKKWYSEIEREWVGEVRRKSKWEMVSRHEYIRPVYHRETFFYLFLRESIPLQHFIELLHPTCLFGSKNTELSCLQVEVCPSVIVSWLTNKMVRK